MAKSAGFVIGNTTYEMPSRLRNGDYVLITEVTGLEAESFAQLLDEVQQARKAAQERLDAGEITQEQFDAEATVPGAARVMQGLMAAGIWQAHTTWPRERARRMAEQLDMENVEFVEGDPAPEAPAAESRSHDTFDDSTTSPEDFEGDLG